MQIGCTSLLLYIGRIQLLTTCSSIIRGVTMFINYRNQKYFCAILTQYDIDIISLSKYNRYLLLDLRRCWLMICSFGRMMFVARIMYILINVNLFGRIIVGRFMYILINVNLFGRMIFVGGFMYIFFEPAIDKGDRGFLLYLCSGFVFKVFKLTPNNDGEVITQCVGIAPFINQTDWTV